ncbi:hypothetical protein BJ165DRAFT_1407528 [Panaeolus papilionaceus]|nr:hypothetical protein BJ165DRAFT_1407528 [Panaeolus papilionaceus]
MTIDTLFRTHSHNFDFFSPVMAITLPENFEYVGASLLFTVFVLLGQNRVVAKRRKAAGIEYPQMYAEKKEMEATEAALLFNCAQRAHQNTLEHVPIIFTTAIIAGAQFPLLAACNATLFNIGRISYTRGYLSGDPQKRSTVLHFVGAAAYMAQLAVSSYVAGSWVYNGLASQFL